MVKDLFFNKLVTKDMQPVHGDERFFEGYLTVQIKDKQGEITVVDELYKVLPIWMDRGAPISDTHSNRIIGKGINYAKATYKDKDGEEYPAIKITGKIHKNYELDNEIWKKIKSGEYKGLSFGGATKSDRDPVRMKDGSIAYSLKDLEHYEVAVCADPAVPLALITDYNPVAKSATNAEVREDGKMVIKCDKYGCYVSKAFVEQPDKDPEPTDDIKNNGSSHFHKFIAMYPESDTTRQFNDPDKKRRNGVSEPFFGAGHFSSALWEGRMADARERADDKNIKMLDGMLNRKIDPNKKREDLDQKTQRLGKTDNITKPIPDSKGGKGDFDHCEEKNQDKNDPAAFCGAIQHKLEKAIEAGMLQQVTKDGLEIFLTKEELNKVCSGCGKTLGEHGIVKYDHSNSMGDQHSMYNQNTGRETWVGQGLPQPTVEGKDDHPAEQGLTINGDARQNSDKKRKKKGKSFVTIFKDEDERRERQGEKERKRNQNFFGDFSGNPDKMTPTPEQIANKKIRDAKEADILARKKLKRGKKKKSFELFKDSVDGKPKEPKHEGGKGTGHAANRTRRRKEREAKQRKTQEDTATKPTKRYKRPSESPEKPVIARKYPNDTDWDKLPDFFKERDFKAQADELKELQRRADILSQKEYPTKRPVETKEDWKKIDDEAGSTRAKEIEDRAASGIQYGKSFGFISKKKPQKMRATVGWKQFIEDSLKDPKVPKEWKAGLGRNRKLFEHLEGNEPPSADKVTMEDSTPKEPNQLGTIDPSKPMTKKDPNIFWGSKDDLDDTEDDDSTETAIGNTQQNKRIFSGLKEKSLVNKRDDWDKDERLNDDAYFGRKKEKPWTSRDQSEFEAFEKLTKLPQDDKEKLTGDLQEAIDGIKLEGKIREGMIGTFGKSFVSIFKKEEADRAYGKGKKRFANISTNVRDGNDWIRYWRKRHNMIRDTPTREDDPAIENYELNWRDEKGHEQEDDDKQTFAEENKSLESIVKRDDWDRDEKKEHGRKEEREPSPKFDYHKWNEDKVDHDEDGVGEKIKPHERAYWDEFFADDYGKHGVPKTRVASHGKSPPRNSKGEAVNIRYGDNARSFVHGDQPSHLGRHLQGQAEQRGDETTVDDVKGFLKRLSNTDPDKQGKYEKQGTISTENAEKWKSWLKQKGDAEANPDMSPSEWLQWYKKRPKKKAEESNFGAGQRGLGYGNEGYTNVQGSGQSHTITEIPPEMEVIVHDVKDIKESKKEGYTTEAGNNKRGDPSRATDDDDSLLSPTFAKKEYGQWLSPKKPTGEEDDDNFEEFGLSDDDTNDKPSKNSLATNFDEPW